MTRECADQYGVSQLKLWQLLTHYWLIPLFLSGLACSQFVSSPLFSSQVHCLCCSLRWPLTSACLMIRSLPLAPPFHLRIPLCGLSGYHGIEVSEGGGSRLGLPFFGSFVSFHLHPCLSFPVAPPLFLSFSYFLSILPLFLCYFSPFCLFLSPFSWVQSE